MIALQAVGALPHAAIANRLAFPLWMIGVTLNHFLTGNALEWIERGRLRLSLDNESDALMHSHRLPLR
jgi:hypothetical protein